MRGVFGSLFEAKASDISALTWQSLYGEPASKAGVSVNINSALRVSTVLSCARVLAEGIAQMPLKLYRDLPNGGKVLAADHPVYPLLYRRPNEWQTAFEMREMMMFHAVLTGNGYAYIGRAGNKVKEIIPLMPERVTPVQAPDYGFTYRMANLDGTYDELPRTSILHIRGPSWNGYRGLDALQQAREAVGLAIATEEAHARLHSNGVKPGGLIAMDGVLGEDARKRLRAAMTEHQGVQAAYKTMILDQGAKWQPFAMTGVDAQHLDTRKFQIEEICRMMRVFPQMVGHSDKTATFASAEAFFLAHVTHSIQPWAERWEESLARDLFPGEDDISARFSMQSLLRGDSASRSAFYTTAINNGWMTRNEARLFEELNPIDGLDEPLLPLNMGTQRERALLAAQVVAGKSSDMEMKLGRALSAANEGRIKDARDQLNAVLSSLPMAG